MDRDFYIRLTFSLYRVSSLVPDPALERRFRTSGAKILADLMVLTEPDSVAQGQKQDVAPRVIREIGILCYWLFRGRRENWIHPDNFSLLEKEYLQIEHDIRDMEMNFSTTQEIEVVQEPVVQEALKQHISVPKPKESAELPVRQKKIVDVLKTKDRVQVWELQKVFPEVTKRTLRRDLDDLLKRDLIVREGEWNNVMYRAKIGAI